MFIDRVIDMALVKDVAERCGISRAYASRQIRGERTLTPEVQRAIRDIRREQEQATAELVAARFAARGLPEVAHSIMSTYTR